MLLAPQKRFFLQERGWLRMRNYEEENVKKVLVTTTKCITL